MPELQTVCCCAASDRLPSRRHSVTAQGVDCAGVLPPARVPFCHSPGRVRAAHSVTARGVDCAGVLPPARLPFCHSPGRVWAAHSVTAQGVDCAGVLPPARVPFCHSPGRGVGRPTSVATAGTLRLARSPLVPHPARRVSSSRRLGYEYPERTFSKATPTRTRLGLHPFACALLQYTFSSSYCTIVGLPDFI